MKPSDRRSGSWPSRRRGSRLSVGARLTGPNAIEVEGEIIEAGRIRIAAGAESAPHCEG